MNHQTLNLRLNQLYQNTIDIGHFELGYRFTEEEYNTLPKEDLDEILPLNDSGTALLDKVIEDLGFRKPYGLEETQFESIIELNLRTQNETQVREWLFELDISPKEQVFLLWDAWGSAITTYGNLIKYYDDFYYPVSDDLMIIDKSLKWGIYFFHEEYIYFGKRASM